MPELPEVEVVRAGLQRFVAGRTVTDVEVRNARTVRRHPGGGAALAAELSGATLTEARRRGKYLWLPLEATGRCLVAHLGMSGQLLVAPATADEQRHLHVRVRFADGDPELRFVDQRTFGGLHLDTLIADGPTDALPAGIAHIARDPLDPLFDDALLARRLRARHTELKRALLDQSLVSGIGNIYADESLWRAKLHPRRATSSLSGAQVATVLAAVREVLEQALAEGGTSFDALYVNVNGQSGYFDRSLQAYGRAGQACRRCGAAIVREAFMNRSSFFCPRCQRAPRGSRT